MRLFDFLSDIQQTSQRIAARGSVIAPDAAVEATLKTLMRQDVIAYMRSLAGADLPHGHLLVMYYVIVFAHMVNAQPAPLAENVQRFARQTLTALTKVEATGGVICDPRKARLPQRMAGLLKPFLDLGERSGIECRFDRTAPDAGWSWPAAQSKVPHASLSLFLLEDGAPFTFPPAEGRIVFSGVIHHGAASPSLAGVYVSPAGLEPVKAA
jgi:hypothetical protein